jgi:hypothetical protein
MKYYSIIKTQSFVETFSWNGINFNSYLISFQNYDGLFRIVRRLEHEQALIGAKIMFNVNDDLTQLSKYKIIGYEEINKTIENDTL